MVHFSVNSFLRKFNQKIYVLLILYGTFSYNFWYMREISVLVGLLEREMMNFDKNFLFLPISTVHARVIL